MLLCRAAAGQSDYCTAIIFQVNGPQQLTHSHIIPGTVSVKLNIQVREVEEDAMVSFHRNDPGTVHTVGVAVGIQGRMDLP